MMRPVDHGIHVRRASLSISSQARAINSGLSLSPRGDPHALIFAAAIRSIMARVSSDDSQVAMMLYGGELVGNNLQQTRRARRPPLPAGPIKPPCRRQGT
jgi:hypothetical protein